MGTLDLTYVVPALCGVITTIAAILWRRETSRNDRAERRLHDLMGDRFDFVAEQNRRFEEVAAAATAAMTSMAAAMDRLAQDLRSGR